MPVETANYISDLVPTNPQLGDNIADGPSHFWLIKKAIQNTFPNIKGAVTASQDQLNTITGLVGSSTSDVLDLKGNLTVEGNLTVSDGVDLKGNTLVPSVTDWTQKQAVPASDADARYMKLTDTPFVDTNLRFQVINAVVTVDCTVTWPRAFSADPVFITAAAMRPENEYYPFFVYINDAYATHGNFTVMSYPSDPSGALNSDAQPVFEEVHLRILVGGYF